MTASTTCSDGPCECGTSAITRLRYTYGQRLTAVDLLDEQLYHRTKDRFVNQHALGYGILCGLTATRGSGPPDLTPTLRVSKGAALDPCGNAIAVGTDQCLDVGAWFAAHRDELGWVLPGSYPAWIGLRYRECPADPVAVPREACGCSNEGCAYTRVHESFELALHAADGAITPAVAPTDPCAPDGSRSSGPMQCPGCDCDTWLYIAGIDVVVEDPGAGARLRAADVTDPDLDSPQRLVLHSLQFVQQLVERLSAETAPCSSGPRVAGVGGNATIEADGSLSDAVVGVRIVLADDPDGAPIDLAEATLPDPPLGLRQLGPGGWEDTAGVAAYDAATSTLALRPDYVELDRPYRLHLGGTTTNPIADDHLQPLRPSPWSVSVRWVETDDGVVVQATT